MEYAKEFAQQLCKICDLEGELEKKRRELALQPDFNMCDTYKMFLRLKDPNVKQVVSDDVLYTLKKNLEIEITVDEVFVIFFKVDKDSDGFWSPAELNAAFLPRSPEYRAIVEERGGFYGAEKDATKYFEPKTRAAMKSFLR